MAEAVRGIVDAAVGDLATVTCATREQDGESQVVIRAEPRSARAATIDLYIWQTVPVVEVRAGRHASFVWDLSDDRTLDDESVLRHVKLAVTAIVRGGLREVLGLDRDDRVCVAEADLLVSPSERLSRRFVFGRAQGQLIERNISYAPYAHVA